MVTISTIDPRTSSVLAAALSRTSLALAPLTARGAATTAVDSITYVSVEPLLISPGGGGGGGGGGGVGTVHTEGNQKIFVMGLMVSADRVRDLVVAVESVGVVLLPVFDGWMTGGTSSSQHHAAA